MLAQSEVTTRVRHPEPEEKLPGEYASYPAPDRSWVWVCETDRGIAGYLMASPCHGLVMLVRAIRVTGDPANWLLSCIRQARADCANRGYTAWFMPLVMSREIDEHLLRLARRFAQVELEPRVVIVMGGKLA